MDFASEWSRSRSAACSACSEASNRSLWLRRQRATSVLICDPSRSWCPVSLLHHRHYPFFFFFCSGSGTPDASTRSGGDPPRTRSRSRRRRTHLPRPSTASGTHAGSASCPRRPPRWRGTPSCASRPGARPRRRRRGCCAPIACAPRCNEVVASLVVSRLTGVVRHSPLLRPADTQLARTPDADAQPVEEGDGGVEHVLREPTGTNVMRLPLPSLVIDLRYRLRCTSASPGW